MLRRPRIAALSDVAGRASCGRPPQHTTASSDNAGGACCCCVAPLTASPPSGARAAAPVWAALGTTIAALLAQLMASSWNASREVKKSSLRAAASLLSTLRAARRKHTQGGGEEPWQACHPCQRGSAPLRSSACMPCTPAHGHLLATPTRSAPKGRATSPGWKPSHSQAPSQNTLHSPVQAQHAGPAGHGSGSKEPVRACAQRARCKGHEAASYAALLQQRAASVCCGTHAERSIGKQPSLARCPRVRPARL